jgi:hypothetical protein
MWWGFLVPRLYFMGLFFFLLGLVRPTAGKPDEQGDLYVTVDVQLPKELTPQQREHFEALKNLQT